MNYTVQVETFEKTYADALPLCEAHWEEVPFGKWPEIGLAVNVDTYLLAEQLGNLLTVTARNEEGGLIGYLLLLGCEMNHHKGHWHCTSDVVYVEPVLRGEGIFDRMLEKAREICEQQGVTFLSIGVNPNYDFSALLERQGAICTEKTFTWRLD
jgi:GNAT superfamily N-acetyltransferase